MKITVKNLPKNLAAAHQMIIDFAQTNTSLSKTNSSLSQKITSLQDELIYLREQLALIRAQEYGASSEKVKRQIDELELGIEASEEAALETLSDEELDGDDLEEEASQPDDADKPKVTNKPRRLKLPEDLPREEIIMPVPTSCPDCGNDKFRTIADDISETLEYVPASLKVIRYVRPRCACINCEKIVQSYPASKPIAKGKAGPGLLAHIILQKYADHLPLYRQAEIFDRLKIEMPISTMSSWMIRSGRLLEPLIEVLRQEIFASQHLHGDDTTVRVLAPGNGKTKTGRFWVYVRDGRPYGDIETPPAVCYFYSVDRKGERPEAHLQNFSGILHADAYGGYNGVLADGTINRAACWAHVRRKFHEVTIASDNAKIALDAVDEIGKLYDTERIARHLDPNKRLELRQKESQQIVDELFKNWQKLYPQLPSKSATSRAISYALKIEVDLRRFLTDGKIEIDNNAAERAMRPIAVGRKNWLFAGSDAGGEAAASMYSLLESCELNNVDPWSYLRWVLSNIQDHNSQKLHELLPWNMPKSL